MANFHRPGQRPRGHHSGNQSSGLPGEEIIRTRLPSGKEVLGVLEQRLGASRNKVRCFDGKSRVCRIPGKLKRKLWVREEDIVLVEPWEFGGDERGDIVYKYRPLEVNVLKKKGFLQDVSTNDEF